MRRGESRQSSFLSMSKAFVAKVVSANRLSDGRVVFLESDRTRWSENFRVAGVWRDAESEATALAAAQKSAAANVVLDVVSIEVTGEGDKLRPVALRETIRASLRPTVAPRMPDGFALDTTLGGGI